MAPRKDDRAWVEEHVAVIESIASKAIQRRPGVLEHVGAWTVLKQLAIKQILGVYLPILKKQNWAKRLIYIDTHAGCGINALDETKKRIAGTALLPFAGDTRFDHYYFVEVDDEKRNALDERLALFLSRDQYSLYAEPATKSVSEIAAMEGNPDTHYLAVVDPYNLRQMDWVTLASIMDAGPGDLVVNYPTTEPKRTSYEIAAAFFGTASIKDLLEKDASEDALLQYFHGRLREHRPMTISMRVRHGQARYHYDLVYATRLTRQGSPFIHAVQDIKQRVVRLTGQDVLKMIQSPRLGSFDREERIGRANSNSSRDFQKQASTQRKLFQGPFPPSSLMRAIGFSVVAALLIAGFAGCLASDEEAKAKSATSLLVVKGAAGLTAYKGPELAIMDTPLANFTKILCDQGGCLRRLTTPATGPANEVMVAQDYTDPAFLIAGSKDYHADNPTCVVVSVYASIDGGRTWKDGYPRPTTGVLGGPSTSRCESDPVAAFDGKGNGFMITLTASAGLYTYRTSDQGKTWTEVAMAFKGGNDKNWAATDYRINRVYSITRATCMNGEAITYTDDSGESWRGPFCFHGMDFAQVAVGPDGTVYAAGTGQGGIAFARSYDGGENWSQAERIAQFAGGVQTTPVLGGHPYRTPTNANLAVAIATGALYVVWHQNVGSQQDVMFTSSRDGGNTWSPAIKVNDDGGTSDQFIPAVAASPAGNVHVIFFDARNDPTGRGHLLDVYYTHSPDGITFQKNLRLTPQSFVPYFSRHQQQPFFIGDYIGLTASNNEAVGVFPVTVNQRAEIHAAIVGG